MASQSRGALGCFAFTERGAGVLSGAGVESTATYDPAADVFVLDSPTPSSTKNWISQGLYAEEAVILADLIVNGERKGPHLFWTPIAKREAKNARPTPLKGVTIESMPGACFVVVKKSFYFTFFLGGMGVKWCYTFKKNDGERFKPKTDE